MYAYLDHPVSKLDPASQLLIWAMRSWVELAGRRQCLGHAIGAVFAQRNMMAGLQPFLRMMALSMAGELHVLPLRLRPRLGSRRILLQMAGEGRSNSGRTGMRW